MAEQVRLVVDASAATKWHLRDEEWVAEADAVLADFRAGRTALLAPAPPACRGAGRTKEGVA